MDGVPDLKCPQCGHDNLEAAQFCGECGASLSASTPIGVGAASSEPPTGSLPKTIKNNHHRRIKPWMWIVSGVVGLLVILYVGFGLMFSHALGCPAFLGCQDWGQIVRGDSYAELSLYERAIQEYDEAIRLERNHAEAYYKRALAYEALGNTTEAENDLERAIQSYDEQVAKDKIFGEAYHGRGLAFQALGKNEQAEQDFAKANDLEHYYYSFDCLVTILDDFTKATKVTPLVLEGEVSGIVEWCQAWNFNGEEGQILQFEPRPKSGSHIDFEHVQIRLSLVDDERLQTADPEVIGKDEELREIVLPETGTYTLQVEGNPDKTSGAYVITISEQHP